MATIDMGEKRGAAVPLSRTAGTTSNTMWPVPRSTSVPSGVFIYPAVWPQQTWAKNWVGWVCRFFLGAAGSPSNTKSPGPRPTSIPSGILVHEAVWPQRTMAKNWGLCPFRGGELGPHLTQCRSRRPTPTSVPSGILIHAAVWPQ